MSENKPKQENPPRVGFYICHCGTNIAGIIDVAEVQKYAAGLPGVAVSRDYKYMCSDPGQEMIAKDIKEHKLERLVVAACSPLLHEETFRKAAAKGGLNPFYFQMVNIREHAAWVHADTRLFHRRLSSQKMTRRRSLPVAGCSRLSHISRGNRIRRELASPIRSHHFALKI